MQRLADRLLFREVDAWSVAVFRIALAIMIAVVFQAGASRMRLIAAIEAQPGLEAAYDAVFLRAPYWWLILALTAILALGWRARATCAVLVTLLLPLVFREGRMQSRLALWLALVAFAFLRSDARLSLTSMLGRVAGERRAGPLWPMRLIQLVLSVLYGVNALAKSTAAYVRGDVILGQSLMLPNYRLDLSGGALELGPIAVPLWAAATATVFTEYALAIGFWFRRLRVAVAVLGIAFHAALAGVIQIGFLDVVGVFLYSAFLLPFERSASGPDRDRIR